MNYNTLLTVYKYNQYNAFFSIIPRKLFQSKHKIDFKDIQFYFLLCALYADCTFVHEKLASNYECKNLLTVLFCILA